MDDIKNMVAWKHEYNRMVTNKAQDLINIFLISDIDLWIFSRII